MINKVKELIGFQYLLKDIRVSFFCSFGIEYIPKEVSNKTKDKSITHNIFSIQSNNSIMCGLYCIALFCVDFIE